MIENYPELTDDDINYCCLYLLGLKDADVSAKIARSSFRAARRLADMDMEGAFDYSKISDGIEGDEEGMSQTDDIPSNEDE